MKSVDRINAALIKDDKPLVDTKARLLAALIENGEEEFYLQVDDFNEIAKINRAIFKALLHSEIPFTYSKKNRAVWGPGFRAVYSTKCGNSKLFNFPVECAKEKTIVDFREPKEEGRPEKEQAKTSWHALVLGPEGNTFTVANTEGKEALEDYCKRFSFEILSIEVIEKRANKQ